MDYKTLYVNLLLKHGSEEKPKDYAERHHIIPKALGGDDSSENLVYLSPRVHFIAHWILFKIHRSPETARALYGMMDAKRRPERGMANSKYYAIAKKAFSDHNHMKLDSHRERACILAREQWDTMYDRMYESNHAMFEDANHPMYMKGKTGDAHPRSRAVITPLGRFGSVREAGRAHGIAHYTISRFCKSDCYPEFRYE